MPNVAMTEVGMATPAMSVERQLRMKTQHDEAREDAAQHQVDVDLVQRRVDVARLVADDLEPDVGRQLGLTRSRPLHGLDHGDGVRAGLPAHLERHRRLAVRAARTTAAPSFRPRQSRCRARGPATRRRVATTRSSKSRGSTTGPWCAALLLAAVVRCPRDIGVLTPDRVANGRDGQAVGRQSVRVDLYLDRSLGPADDSHLADARARSMLHA